MRAGGGKQKGASFEREICKDLSLWVSNGTQEDVYWRAAMSGGRATVAHRKGKRLAAQSGDISCVHHIGSKFSDLFFIECKHYADLNLLGLFTGKGHLIEFWGVANEEAKKYGKHPLLIAKQNRLHAMACLCEDGAQALGLEKRSQLIAPARNLRIIPWFEFLSYAERP